MQLLFEPLTKDTGVPINDLKLGVSVLEKAD